MNTNLGSPDLAKSRTAGCRQWARRIVLGLLDLLLLTLLVGVVWQAVAGAAERRNYRPPGQMVDVGGHHLHLQCAGQGTPTVADEQGPYLLVAHSSWGPAALMYQHSYADDAAGMVLVETWGPELFSPVPDAIEQSLPLNQIMSTLASLGQVRLFGELGLLPLEEMLKANLLPDEVRPVYKTAYYGASFWRTMKDECSALAQSATQIQHLGSLGDLPLRVINAGIRPADDYPPDAIWNEVHNKLAGLSSNGKLIVANTSGHFVQLEQPDLVADTVWQVYDETRQSVQRPSASRTAACPSILAPVAVVWSVGVLAIQGGPGMTLPPVTGPSIAYPL